MASRSRVTDRWSSSRATVCWRILRCSVDVRLGVALRELGLEDVPDQVVRMQAAPGAPDERPRLQPPPDLRRSGTDGLDQQVLRGAVRVRAGRQAHAVRRHPARPGRAPGRVRPRGPAGRPGGWAPRRRRWPPPAAPARAGDPGRRRPASRAAPPARRAGTAARRSRRESQGAEVVHPQQPPPARVGRPRRASVARGRPAPPPTSPAATGASCSRNHRSSGVSSS